MDILSSIILGVVQGVTEFLPISSTGHLVLMRELLGVDASNALAYDAILHLATAAAVMVYFFDELWILLQTLLRKLGRMPVNDKDITLLYALGVGTVPAVALGVTLESFIENQFRHPLMVAAVLVIGSVFFMFAEYYYQNHFHERPVTPKLGFRVGLFQALALLPGFSRSGATIAGGMLLGLTRTDAARFAFLLALPVILGAGSMKVLELIRSDVVVDWLSVTVGAMTAFMVGLLAIHFMLSFVRRHTLWPFIWYRIILAGFVVFIFIFG